MKKNNFIAIILSAICVFSVCITSCKNVSEKPLSEIEQGVQYNGNHTRVMEATDQDLLKDGRSEYKLIIPKNATNLIKKAKGEFTYLFDLATGVPLECEEDGDGKTHNAQAKYISIGETTLLASSGIKVDKAELGQDGLRIVTKDNTVYIVGGGDYGTLYGVYIFMELMFNFEQYSMDCFEIDRNVKNLKLQNFEVTEIPDIATRIYGTDIFSTTDLNYDESNAKYRMRMGVGLYDKIIPINPGGDYSKGRGNTIHNSFDYLPQEKWNHNREGGHPEWFAASGNQLCYTAHGDNDSWELMAKECARVMGEGLKYYSPVEYPDKNIVTLTVQDGKTGFCECSACLSYKSKYNTEVAGVIRFLNRVAELIEDWMEKEENSIYAREDLKILFFAYNGQIAPPATFNETTGQYEMLSEEVMLHPRVCPFYAENTNADYTKSLFSEDNKLPRQYMRAWGDLTDNVYLWLYSTDFHQFLYPHDSFSFYTNEAYAYMAECNVTYLFNQSQTHQKGAMTAWHDLKTYIESKLAWDSSLDTQEVMNKYFNAVFKEAAPIMKNFFNEQRTWIQKVYEEESPTTLYGRSYWPYMTLMKWQNDCKNALKSVEKYKNSEPKLYETIRDHIDAEWISPAYIMLQHWDNGSIPSEYRTELIEKLREVVLRLGMTAISESSNDFINYVESLK